MELISGLPRLVADLLLLIGIGYAAYYAVRRISRYEEPLNGLVKITALSLLLATIGRALDVIDDFGVSDETAGVLMKVEFVLYFFSILGTIYGIIRYISTVEKRLFPPPRALSVDSRVKRGAYLFISEAETLEDLLRVIKAPVLLITRNPDRYGELPPNVSTLWVTPSSERGISPTKLHVLLESAVKFVREGGRIVVVDCVEALILYNDFRAVFKFLTALKDNVLAGKGTLIVTVGRGTIDERDFNVLTREFIPVSDVAELFKTSS